MRVSIVTPVRNGELYIRETIDSIAQQTYKDFEHIVIDALSSDRTLEIVREYSHIKYVSERDNGQSDAINKGFRMATGEILAWQNADDVYEPDALEVVVDFFRKNPDVSVVYGFYQLIDSESRKICNVYPIDWNTWLFKHGRFVPVQPTVFWRRRVFESVGFLNEKLHYCMDVDFFCRAVNLGFRFRRIPKVLGKFRIHTESKTQNSVNEEAVFAEFQSVLSGNFNYNWMDLLVFKLLKLRTKIGKYVKIRFSK